jgi:2-polyprenyl-3-methyl-5-hydroxy-6-metoxy-1,4-benzoquinol methylase
MEMNGAIDKFDRQNRSYRFPYHYIPHFDKHTGAAVTTRFLGWGLEYLCYIKHIQELAYSLSPNSILDIGCGDGRFIGSLSPRITRKVGTDLSERAIRFAKAFHPEIEFHAINASDLNETFDLVVSIEVLEHIPENQISSFIGTLSDRTRVDGHVLISVPTKVARLLGKHYRHYDLNLLKDHLACAKVPLTLIGVDYVYRKNYPLLLHMIMKLSQNKWWAFDLYKLRAPIWRYIWEKHRFATPADGRHLIALLRKNSHG